MPSSLGSVGAGAVGSSTGTNTTPKKTFGDWLANLFKKKTTTEQTQNITKNQNMGGGLFTSGMLGGILDAVTGKYTNPIVQPYSTDRLKQETDYTLIIALAIGGIMLIALLYMIIKK